MAGDGIPTYISPLVSSVCLLSTRGHPTRKVIAYIYPAILKVSHVQFVYFASNNLDNILEWSKMSLNNYRRRNGLWEYKWEVDK